MLVFRHVGEPQETVEHSGIADKDVEPAKGGDGLGDRALVVVEPADIAGDRDYLVAKPRAQLLAAAGSAVHDRDSRALLDVALDDSAADARAAARHQRDLAIEPAHHGASLFACNPRLSGYACIRNPRARHCRPAAPTGSGGRVVLTLA